MNDVIVLEAADHVNDRLNGRLQCVRSVDDRRVEVLVPYMLTISCGGTADLACTQSFLARHGLAEEDLVEFRYRGHGWPGDHYARAHDGREAREWYAEMIYGRARPYQFRCKLCPDHTGEQADVSVMDPWPKGFPEEEAPAHALGSQGFTGIWCGESRWL